MLRDEYRKLFDRLAGMGADVQGMFEMTPREIGWRIEAMAQARRTAAELLRQVAWLTGKYAGIAVNAPEKYPPYPAARPAGGPMSEEEMRRVLEGLARRNGRNEA